MAYGRLDIHWPDGRVDSYLLDAPTVTVGRAPDNTIVLDIETISRHHFSITHTKDNTYLSDLDSENGVILDGVRLKSTDALMLDEVEDMQVGMLRIIYHPIDETVTAPMRALDQDTQPNTRTNAAFGVLLDHNEVGVWPASSSSVEVSITNYQRTLQTYILSVSGMPLEWLRVNRPEVEITPGDTTQVLINIKPPRRPDVRPADYTVTVEITPKETPETALKATFVVHLHAYGGFGMALSSRGVVQGEPASLYLHNQGNEDLTLALTTKSVGNAVALRFSMPRVTLAAGARSTVRLDAVPVQNALVGNPNTLPFTVEVRAHNAAHFLAAMDLTLTTKPRLLMRHAVALAAGGVVVLILGLVALLALLTGNQTPTLENLAVVSADLAPGEPIQLSWSASNVQQIKININGILVDEVPGETRSISLPSDDYSGDVAITVQGENGERSATASIVVQVAPALAITAFSAAPDAVLRNVITNLTLTWQTVGAANVTISGLEDFTTQPLPATFETTGTLVLDGFASVDALDIELIAENADGTRLVQPLDLIVSDPTCTTTREVPLYEGPDTSYQQVSVAPINTPLIVQARDGSGNWLRVDLTTAPSAWGERQLFICTETLVLNNLRIDASVPPPPTSAPTLAVTLGATPTQLPTSAARPTATSAAPATP